MGKTLTQQAPSWVLGGASAAGAVLSWLCQHGRGGLEGDTHILCDGWVGAGNLHWSSAEPLRWLGKGRVNPPAVLEGREGSPRANSTAGKFMPGQHRVPAGLCPQQGKGAKGPLCRATKGFGRWVGLFHWVFLQVGGCWTLLWCYPCPWWDSPEALL